MDDRTQLDQPGDEEELDKTEAMNKPSRKKASPAPSEAGGEAGSEAKKEEKKKGRDEWQTVQSPKAQRPAASPPTSAASSGSAASAARPATPPPAGPVSGSSAMPSAQSPQNPAVSPNVPAVPAPAASGVPLGAQLSRMGINNPTAQWASLGVGAFALLCCACSCVGLVIYAASAASSLQ